MALVDHNYGVTKAEGIPPLLAVPVLGDINITVKNNAGDVVGKTTATKKGEWRQSFDLADGNYTVEFRGRFRPIGIGFKASYNSPVTSLTIPITVPLSGAPSNGQNGGGRTGPQGPQGAQGSQGSEGPIGDIGPAGDFGATGPEGPQGEQGVDGIGAQGAPGTPGSAGGAGPAGPQGSSGGIGPQGIPGSLADSCELDIGTPADGYISDGFFPWSPDTKVCNALDDLNEILAELAPASPLSLAGASLVSTAITFAGFASDKTSQNYKLAAGENVDGTYLGGAIVLIDIFTLTNPTTGDSEAGGDDTFYPGDEGTLSSRITAAAVETEEGSINLASASPPETDLSLTLNAQNSGYNGFTAWVRGDATIDVSTYYLQEGYNKIVMRHVTTTTVDSEEYEVFYDMSDAIITFTSATSLLEDGFVVRELSGIQHYTLGATFILSFISIHNFKDTFLTDAFNWSALAGNNPGTVSLTDTAWAGSVSVPPEINDIATLSGVSDFTLTLDKADERSIDTTVLMTCKKPGRTDVTSQSVSENRLVDTFSDGSTDLDEPFDDENYRLPDNDGSAYPDNYDTEPASTTGNWTSTANLVNGEAAVFQGSLYHATGIGSSGDFTGFLPAGPDYSSFTSDAIYLRAFIADDNPHNSATIKFDGLSVSEISPLGTGDINVEIKLPSETGWLDLGSTFNVALFTGADGDGCQTSQSTDEWSITFGTFSTANSDFMIIVRVTILNTSSSLARMRVIDW